MSCLNSLRCRLPAVSRVLSLRLPRFLVTIPSSHVVGRGPHNIPASLIGRFFCFDVCHRVGLHGHQALGHGHLGRVQGRHGQGVCGRVQQECRGGSKKAKWRASSWKETARTIRFTGPPRPKQCFVVILFAQPDNCCVVIVRRCSCEMFVLPLPLQ